MPARWETGRRVLILATRGNNGLYRSLVDARAGFTRACTADPRLPALRPPALDDCSADVRAADFDRRLPHHLSRFLFDLSVDAEQGADALYRPVEFRFPDVARHVLDGGVAIDDLRALRGVLQSPDRIDYRAYRQ